MEKLSDLDWFTERWATDVRDAARRLVRLYAEALANVEALPKWVQIVSLLGVRSRMRPLLIFKPLLRDAVVEHIRQILRQTLRLSLRAFMASHPLPEETGLPVKKTAPAEVIARATAKRDEFVARQQRIASLLEEATRDVKGFLEVLGVDEKVGERTFRTIVRAARWFLPFLWAGVVISRFDQWSGQSQLQLLAFLFGTAVVYHLAAWFTLPFHDAGERKYVYFEGYTGGGTDGLRPLFPQASRYENALFLLFRSKPPVVISWETIIPLLHYALISILLVVMLIKLPFSREALVAATIFVGSLIVVYLRTLILLWHLLRIRYRERSAWEIGLALVSSLGALKQADESGDSEADGDISTEKSD